MAFGAAIGLIVQSPILDALAATDKIVYSFCTQQACADGAEPLAGLLVTKGILYGTTSGGGTGSGTVFSFDPSTGSLATLHSFLNNPDGADPASRLMKMQGLLYGTTAGGGVYRNGYGTVFSLDPHSGNEAVLHSFAKMPDGVDPAGVFISVDGHLVGTKNPGVSYELGTV